MRVRVVSSVEEDIGIEVALWIWESREAITGRVFGG